MEKNIYELKETSKHIVNNVNIFFKEHGFKKLLKSNAFKKIEGVPCLDVLKTIFTLIFTGKNWYRTIKDDNGRLGYKKDVVYRFLNSFKYKWEKLLLSLSSRIISWLNSLVSKDRASVLIADDTFYNRTRSKKVELLSRVYDHVDNKIKKGFTKLTLGWSDGNTYIPISFHLLCSSKNLLTPSTYVNEKYPGHKRRENAKRKKTDLLVEMVKVVQDKSICFKYLLFDSWFAFPKLITRFVQMKVQIITMLKKMPKVFYEYGGKELTLSSIYSKIKSKLTKKNNIVSVNVFVCNYNAGVKTKAKIVFIRDTKTKKWVALLSTDTNLSDEEIIRIYGKRWNIEIFFKMCKSYLKLAKEFEGRIFDMLAAHTTIVYLRYIMLAVASRKTNDHKTFGDLFFNCCDEVKDISFFEALQLILVLLKEYLKDKFSISDKKIYELLDAFITSLPPFLKENLSIK